MNNILVKLKRYQAIECKAKVELEDGSYLTASTIHREDDLRLRKYKYNLTDDDLLWFIEEDTIRVLRDLIKQNIGKVNILEPVFPEISFTISDNWNGYEKKGYFYDYN